MGHQFGDAVLVHLARSAGDRVLRIGGEDDLGQKLGVIRTVIEVEHHARLLVRHRFARAFQGYGIKDALVLGGLIGVVTQIVIFASTVASYALGLSTLWNSPAALNQAAAVPMGAAMLARTGGLVVNTILNVIAAAIGFAMGGSLKPAR